MSKHETITYVEYPARDLEKTKQFFSTVFGWKFKDFSDCYSAFTESNAGFNGGFYRCEKSARIEQGSALLVMYSLNLEATQAKIELAGGVIVKPIFTFPGGRRFHYCEPSGNELAVWSNR